MENFKKVLVVVDTSKSQHPEVERALKLADQTGVTLHLVDIVRDPSLTMRWLSSDYAHLQEQLVQEKQAALDKIVAHCRAHGVDTSGEILHGASSAKTIEVAKQGSYNLIIRSSKGVRSLETGTLGASSKKLIRCPPCPIWLVQPEHEPSCKKIMACVDAIAHNESHQKLNSRILSVATGLAKLERCTLIVAYVWNLYGADMLRNRLPQAEYDELVALNRKQHQASFEELLSAFGLHATGPEARLIEGEPSLAIPETCDCEGVDLLICGTVARSGLSGLMLGNTAERIVDRVHASVLALTPEA